MDGDVSHSARLLNQPFRKHARTGRPLVIFKSAMSLDGKVATQTGDSKWISGEESRGLVHRWRAEVDAICVGIGTALADDPLLTARAPEATRQPDAGRVRLRGAAADRQPARAHRARGAADRGRVARRRSARSVEGLRAAGAEIDRGRRRHRGGAGRPTRSTSSGRMGIQSMLLEGGPRLAGAFLDAGEVDEMRIFIAPIALGGRGARMSLEGEGADSIAARAACGLDAT